nr:MAG TPA: hypothetical protein [Caudoviricetes sp.]
MLALTVLQILNVALLITAIWLRLDALRIRRRRLTVLKEIRKIQNKRRYHPFMAGRSNNGIPIL